MTPYHPELTLAISIAKEAGNIMRKYFDEDQGVKVKTDGSVVTIVDKLINSLVIESLAKAFPEDGVIGEEESTAEYGAGRKWICDPVDGTAAYVWGVPTAMFSLGLVMDGVPVVGVAYDPFLDKMYTGVKGTQSQCNGKPISVSKESLAGSIVGLGGRIQILMEESYVKKLIEKKMKLACYSGAVHKACLIAKGKFVGFMGTISNPHDVAAVHVIVEGAGGKITSVDGSVLDYSKPFKGCIVSNGVVHEELLECMK